MVRSTDVAERLEHARGLPHQGEVHRLVEEDAATIWSETVQKLPPEGLKFAMNAVQDTLPHNANLAVWRRSEGLSSQCKLCGERQTLAHVLNHCQVALELRRYNSRHDAVLEVIDDFVRGQRNNYGTLVQFSSRSSTLPCPKEQQMSRLTS